MQSNFFQRFRIFLLVPFALVLFIALTQVIFAQQKDNIKSEFFRELDAAFEKARNEGVLELTPKLYSKALKLYKQAEKDYDKGERVDKIRKRIKEAIAGINEAISVAEISRVALAELLEVRQEVGSKREYIALKPKEFAAAERKAKEAMAKGEDGDIKSARNKANEAIKLYRQMTVKAILDGPVKTTEEKLKREKNLSKNKRKQSQKALKKLKKSLDAAKKQAFNISDFDDKVLAELHEIVPGRTAFPAEVAVKIDPAISPASAPGSSSPSGGNAQLVLEPDIPHPAVVATGGERLEIFTVGKNSHLVQRSWNGQSWSGWKNLDGDLTAAATAVSPSPGRIDVFVRGANGKLVQRTWRNGNWSGWNNLGGELTSAPAAVSPSPGRMDVFIRGDSGNLVQRIWRDGQWSGWINLGGELGSAPSVTSPAQGEIEVFVRGRNHHLVQRSYRSGSWSGWENHGGDLTAAPSVAAFGPDDMHVFVRGASGHLVQKSWNGHRWSGWKNLGGDLTAAPAAVAYSGSKLEVFVRGKNDDLVRRRFRNSAWGGWENLGGDMRGHLWKRIKVLTHNVYAFDKKGCKSRARGFGNHVANAARAYDIVAVQEYYDNFGDFFTCDSKPLSRAIWSTGRYKNKNNYYRFRPSLLLESNGGIGIFTLHPITKFVQEKWRDDKWVRAEEGFIFARIKVPNTPITLDVYIVHVSSGASSGEKNARRNQLFQLGARIQKYSSKSGNPVIIMGDFNIGGPPALDGKGGYRGNDGYHNLIMSTFVNPIDIWNTTHPEKEGFTFDGPANNVTSDKSKYRIDYIFVLTSPIYTNSPYRVSVNKRSDVKLVKWKDSNGRHVSDHFGLEATLEIRDR